MHSSASGAAERMSRRSFSSADLWSLLRAARYSSIVSGTAEFMSVELPLDDGAGPGQPAAEDHHEDVIAGLQAAGAVRFIERDGDGGGGRVAVTVHINEKTIERNFQPLGDGFDDPDIGLVGNDAGDVVDREAGLVESLLRGIEHRND